MIGLQRSSGSSSINDRRHHNNYNNFNQQSLPTSNIRLINAFKQQENKRLNQQWSQDTNPNQQQQIYPGQHSSMMSISSRMFLFVLNYYIKFCCRRYNTDIINNE
jgi:hypothetical protein